MAKEYCERCRLPLREWEWSGRGWCEVCDEATEGDKMQIEVGEYKTRGGDDVVIVAVVDGFAIGYYAEDGPKSVTVWKAGCGKNFIVNDRESPVDLVVKNS